jgi:hypothetical protein
VLRATDQVAIARFNASLAHAVAARQYSAIITEGPGPPPGFPAWISAYYRQCPEPLLAGVPVGLFRPVAGDGIRPVALWLPYGSVSCQTAVSIIDGTGRGSRQ